MRKGREDNGEEIKDKKKEQMGKKWIIMKRKRKPFSCFLGSWVLGILRHAVMVYISLTTYICLTIFLQDR